MTSKGEPRRIVIAGAGAAGLSVAETARSSGYGGEIILLGRERHLPYDRPPLSKQVLSGAWAPERTYLRERQYLDDLGITMRANSELVGLDDENREVILADGERVWFDDLAIATGVCACTLRDAPDAKNLHVLRELDHATALRDQLLPGTRLVIIGAGVLGSEVAAVATALGVHVTLVDPQPLIMARIVGPKMSELISDLHTERGGELKLGVGVAHLAERSGQVEAVHLTDGQILTADTVLVAIGSVPNTGWLADTAVQLGGPSPADGSGGILCTRTGSAAERIFAAGDVAAWWNDLTGGYHRVEHRLSAAEQGRTVARAILQPGYVPTETVPYFWSDQYGLKIQCFGSSAPDDEFVIVEGSLAERQFIGAYIRAGEIAAITGIGLPRQIRSWSARIVQPLAQANISA